MLRRHPKKPILSFSGAGEIMKLQYQHVFSVGLFLAGLMVCSFAQAEPVKVIGDSPVTLPAMREPTIGILKPTYSPPTNGQEPKQKNT